MTIPRPSRRRRILKWVGLVVCEMIVVAWGVSLMWVLVYYGSHEPAICCVAGCVVLDWQYYGIRYGPCGGAVSPRLRDNTNWGFVLPTLRHQDSPDGILWAGEIPLWLPWLGFAIPTAFLFYRDRRRIPPGHCQTCSYNLTGNESGTCPECGQSCEESLKA